ncbi:MAG: hypothetical protein HY027_04485 [Deltaproteobacteria bacterium]|nr:hypothetical protein [Deltaproteobacteria bacterium]
MMRIGVLWLLCSLSVAAVAGAGEDAASPHHMIGPDGQAEMEKCSLCHNEDLSLQRSKVETCTLCHPITVHSGANEHLRADAAAVAKRVPAPKEGETALPLTEDGRIYCGTCHVFHDPAISQETTVPSALVPAPSGLPESVRGSITKRWEAAAAARGESRVDAKFTSQGTQRLRLPVDDGSLCRHCHEYSK